MNVITRRQWLQLVVYTLAGGILFYGMVATADSKSHRMTTDVGSYAAGAFLFFTDMDVKQYSHPRSVSDGWATGQETLIIGLDQEKSVSGATIIYRGLESGSRFRLDVIIHELDPDVAYPRVLSKSEAREGFRLADETFQLLAVRKRYISLAWLKQGRL